MLNAREIPMQVNMARTIYEPIQFLAQSVGSGKTQAAINDIRDKRDGSYIFVSPTRKLALEIYKRLNEALVENVIMITSDENDKHRQPVWERVLECIHNREPNETHVLVITTETFRNVLPKIAKVAKAHYNVYLDEGIDAIEHQQFCSRVLSNYTDLLDQNEDKLITIAEGCEDKLRAVAFSPDKLALTGEEHLRAENFIPIAKMLVSDLYDVYGTITDKSISVVSMLKPSNFMGFKSVTMIAAIFEQSLLAMFWNRKYGVQLEEYETNHEMFDTHQAKGKRMRIHYMLHPDDHASSENLKRSWQTGDRSASPRKQERVIDKIGEIIETEFGEQPYCWAANDYFKNSNGVMSGKRMPAISAGLDEFKRFDIVASLVCINPPPWVKDIVVKHLGMEDAKLYALWKLSHTYQAIGRCSIRDRESNRWIDVVVLSQDCARRIQDLFPGSKIVGQLGGLPCYRNMKRKVRYTLADNNAYYKYKKRHHAAALDKERWYRMARQSS